MSNIKTNNKSYTESDILRFYKKAIEYPNLFYKYEYKDEEESHSILVNYTGSTTDTNTPYTDYIARQLLDSNIFEEIDGIENLKGYIVGHKGNETDETNRIEDRFAKALFRAHKSKEDIYKNTDLGYVCDYQTPLTRPKQTGIGNIDLLSISSKNQELLLLELKADYNDETLLRATCEIYTYFKQVDKNKLKNQLKVKEYNVVPAILIFENSVQHKQYNNEKFSNVKALIKKLGIKVFMISAHEKLGMSNLDAIAQNCTIKEI